MPLKLIKFLRPKWRERYQKTQLLSCYGGIKKKFRRRRLSRNPSRLLRRHSRRNLKRRSKKGRRPFFSDSVSTRKASYFRWKKLKFNYKNQVILKNKFYSFFNNSIRKAWFKNKFKTTDVKKDVLSLFLNTVVQSCFRLDYLLASSSFFKNIFQARPHILGGLVLVNSKKTAPNCILQCGDVISFLNTKENSKFSDRVNSKKMALSSHVFISAANISLKLPLSFRKISKIFTPLLFYFQKFSFIRSRALASLYSSVRGCEYRNIFCKSNSSASSLKYFSVFQKFLRKKDTTQFINNLSSHSVNRYFFTFLEVDPYTKNVVVLSNYTDLRTLDFTHITMLSFNPSVLKKFIAFFRF